MIGVSADDTTGATDIGLMFFRSGRSVNVVSAPDSPWQSHKSAVTILDTDSRLCVSKEAYNRAYQATLKLSQAGATHFFKKTCSVFRGNIGAEFDAMLDALGEKHMIISLAYPELGRTTLYGYHFVNGVPLHETAFADDPVHPMDSNSLEVILSRQSNRKAATVTLSTVRAGPEALKRGIDRLKNQAFYIIVDGETEEDLQTLGAACAGERVMGGAAAIAQYWQNHERPSATISANAPHSENETSTLVLCGSLTPQSLAQTQRFKDSGYPSAEFPAQAALNGSIAETSFQNEITEKLTHGLPLLIHTPQQTTDREKLRTLAKAKGISQQCLGKLISTQLGSLAKQLVRTHGIRDIIVLGGDTSASVCQALDIKGLRIIGEVEPGIPACASLDGNFSIVLKSGSFGSTDFIEKCVHFLQGKMITL